MYGIFIGRRKMARNGGFILCMQPFYGKEKDG